MKPPMIRPRGSESSALAVALLLLAAVIGVMGCKKGVSISVKAPCKIADIQISDVTLTAHDTSGYTFFEFNFCLKCPGGPENQGVPIANVPVTISVDGTNVSETVTSDANGCVKATASKAVVDVGTGSQLNGKTVKITLEGSDGKKELPGSFTLKGS